jgi:SNF2 family DNA or RNA helicase
VYKIENLRVSLSLAKVSDNVDDYREAMRNLKEGISSKFTEMAKLRQQIALLKVPYVVEHVRNASSKVVIFAHHKAVVSALKKELGEEAVVLVGDTKMEDRQAAVDAFQNDPGVLYFIGSIQAAGVGITLTAASHVVFAELDWVPGNMSQAEDRCHRIGQHESVLVQHLVMEGSLDSTMAQSLIDKQEVIDRALDKETEEIAYPEFDGGVKLPSFEKIEKEIKKYSDKEKEEFLTKLRTLASYDLDRAAVRNDIGFNRFDGKLGHSLAGMEYLTDKQAYLAEKLVTKYRKQLEEL